jgi:hypothetical protein
VNYKFTLSQKALLLLSIVLFGELFLVFVLTFLHESAVRQVKAGLRAQAIIGHLNKTSNLCSKVGVEFPRTLGSLDAIHSQQLVGEVGDLRSELKILQDLVANESKEKASVNVLVSDTEAALGAMTLAKDAWYEHEQNGSAFNAHMTDVVRLSEATTNESRLLISELIEVQERHKRQQQGLNRQFNLVLGGGFSITIITAVLLAYVFIASIARRTEIISSNIKRLVHGIPLADQTELS